MTPITKIPRALLLAALADLERPHPFAGERLGFFSFRQSFDAAEPMLLCFEYHSIPDDQYVEDYSVGGRIGGEAIQAAMSRAYNNVREDPIPAMRRAQSIKPLFESNQPWRDFGLVAIIAAFVYRQPAMKPTHRPVSALLFGSM